MLLNFMTETATTTRRPAVSDSDGARVTNLQAVKICAPMLANAVSAHQVRQMIGLEGTAIQIFETYTESHAHTDGGVSVTQVPDIRAGDLITIVGVTYAVRLCEQQPPTTSYGATLLIYITEDKRA